jgi:hypothetical protein
MALTQHLDPGVVIPTNAIVGAVIATTVGSVLALFRRRKPADEEILDVQPVNGGAMAMARRRA